MPETFQTDGIAVYLVPAPPVYDAGGPAAFVPEMPDSTPSQTMGTLETEATKRRSNLVVVQCPSIATQQEAMLKSRGYTFASSWYVGPPTSQQPASDSQITIRSATATDVMRILEIRDKKYDQYETFSPVFWKKRRVPLEQWEPFMTNQIESDTNITLVAEQDGAMRGFIMMSCRNQGFVDDYAVADPLMEWPGAGVALLAEAGRLAQTRNVTTVTIVAGHADTPKRAAIESLGYVLHRNWMVKPL